MVRPSSPRTGRPTREGHLRAYKAVWREVDNEPLFAFGHGLSYTLSWMQSHYMTTWRGLRGTMDWWLLERLFASLNLLFRGRTGGIVPEILQKLMT